MTGGIATSGVRPAPGGDPPDFEAIGQAGLTALQRGDTQGARAAFEQITAAGRGNAQVWWLLAHVCALQGDEAGEERALDGVLAVDPRHLAALLRRGDRAHAKGDDRGAVAFYRFAISSAEVAERIDPAIERQLEQAHRIVAAAEDRFAQFVGTRLDVAADRLPGRFAESLDLMAGRKSVYLQQPTSFFYPQLPHVQFYETAGLSWATRLEAAAPAILAEFGAAMEDNGGQLRPYVEAVAGRPNGEHALLDDPSWSALHLFKDGRPVEVEARRFPQTMAALQAAPLPVIAGRSPMALFSVLEAHTHIPPHNGMLNTRLICHLPLIVPEGCRLRVGNEMRAVEHGKVMLFDDSIEHEAWNDSDERRVVLLFEVWRPELSEEEQTLLTKLYEAVQDYDRLGSTGQGEA